MSTQVNQGGFYLIFPTVQVNLDTDVMTVSVGSMKCNNIAIVYFKLHCLDKTGTELETYTGRRWVVDNVYKHYEHTFEISEIIKEDLHSVILEMGVLNVTSENPLRFTEVMLQDGVFTEYHNPNSEKDVSIAFEESNYVQLYTKSDDKYLQVIRPKRDGFSTKTLKASPYTVLVPHLEGESEFDNPISIMYEFMNQREQRIDIERG